MLITLSVITVNLLSPFGGSPSPPKRIVPHRAADFNNIFDGHFIPLGLFIAANIAARAALRFCSYLLRGGKEVIERRGAEVEEKVTGLKLLQADAESLVRRYPQYAKQLKEVAEAIKHSDPMSRR